LLLGALDHPSPPNQIAKANHIMRPDAWHWVTANPSIQSALEAV
jgi:hypothetical protein